MKARFLEVKTPNGMEAARSVRLKVFVEEQNVPISIEMDEHDGKAVHVLCLLAGWAVGTGRLVRMPDGIKLGRVAVLPQHRGKGLGTGIVKWLLERAQEMGDGPVYAHVQVSAKGFYEKLGFTAVGDVFIEAGIEHVKMLASRDAAALPQGRNIK